MTGLDHGRSLYPVVLIVIASYDALFAVMGGSPRSLLPDRVPMAAFVPAAMLHFRGKLWWVVAALAAHGLFDFFAAR